ncbi:Ail/Lom family outer membrane beta-barrel protein [Pantoea ananatis]|uniref:Ail/Lom family outer membrane beta-barrel protein n=1 Tax=Pantoea ananas TaxID=553 RepID=UPI0032EF5EB3
MRCISFVAAGCFLGMFSSISSASETSNAERKKHTVSLGYVYTDVSGGIKNKYTDSRTGAVSEVIDSMNWQDGLSLKYRYEKTESWGGIVSLTNSSRKLGEKNATKELTYSSLMAGPAYRFNDYISTYAVAGISKGEYKFNDGIKNKEHSSRGLVSGVGVQINPVEALSLDLGYEYSRIKYQSNISGSYSSWIVSAGYRF